MKKITSLLSILLISIFITACGTTNTESQDTPDKQLNENENTEQTTTETGQVEGDTGSNTDAGQELKGIVTTSDNQNYSIVVAEGFELTGEEPNRDMLYNKTNDEQSMRIETFDATEVNLEDITSNLVETLKASNETGTVSEITDEQQLPIGDSVEEVKGFQIDTPDGKVSGYTFITNGMVVKLTVFDTKDAPALGTFIEMAKTIKSK
ncbi:hypothetical protein [Psychrobacillus vulpis]|uniref:Lipoprotein n=1 Tax=Psychrobacillus vulpis TaxID=2325572 RepID=A0A544TRV3_9BACI|nr:hypothetical protein [Psychrobacillus vulpis]TQR20183.1 hypothetical protein FG384_08445 [Psychrobacillus vulpis]